MKEISDTFLACLGISNTIILLCILIIIAKNTKQIISTVIPALINKILLSPKKLFVSDNASPIQ